jgi:hypothetical protein
MRQTISTSKKFNAITWGSPAGKFHMEEARPVYFEEVSTILLENIKFTNLNIVKATHYFKLTLPAAMGTWEDTAAYRQFKYYS